MAVKPVKPKQGATTLQWEKYDTKMTKWKKDKKKKESLIKKYQ